jgi:hypothetical protein
MAPKRKALNPPKNTKLVKKGCKMKMDDSSSWKEDDTQEKYSKGKNNNCDMEEKQDYLSIKMEMDSPYLFDENKKTNVTDFSNLALNQLLKKKQN